MLSQASKCVTIRPTSHCAALVLQQEGKVREGTLCSSELLPNSVVRVKVEVPAKDVRLAYERGLQQARKRLEIPGFRKGKKVC